MLYARSVVRENIAYPLKSPKRNKVTSRKSKKLWTKGPEWNNATHEEKEKSTTTSHTQHMTPPIPTPISTNKKE